MNDKASDDKPWWKSLPTLDEIRARPRRTLLPHQQAALAEAAAVFLEGGAAALASHLEKQRLEKERQDRQNEARARQASNTTLQMRLRHWGKSQPSDLTPCDNEQDNPNAE